MFFGFFKLYKWYQIAQSVSYCLILIQIDHLIFVNDKDLRLDDAENVSFIFRFSLLLLILGSGVFDTYFNGVVAFNGPIFFTDLSSVKNGVFNLSIMYF